jgi:hypothetical protein
MIYDGHKAYMVALVTKVSGPKMETINRAPTSPKICNMQLVQDD